MAVARTENQIAVFATPDIVVELAVLRVDDVYGTSWDVAKKIVELLEK